MTLRRTDSLGYLLALTSRLYDKNMDQALKPFGAAAGQYAPLMMLFEHDGLTQAELCQRIQVEQPTMANTLNRMERDGLIERRADPTDKRRATIHLTAQARRRRADLIKAARIVPDQALSGFSPAEQEKAMSLLAQMISNLDNPEAQ